MTKLMKIVGTLLLLGSMSLFATQIEVLNWWTSGGEAKAAGVLKSELDAHGYTWKNFAVAGGNGSNAMAVLKSRVMAGNPPSAAQIKGPSIQQWAQLGVLGNLNPVAKANHWNKILPKEFQKIFKYKGHYVAVPVNVHKVNWMFLNPAIFKKSGASIPRTWAQFKIAAQKIKAAGFIPLAVGGQPWQETLIYESVVLGSGPSFYKKALVDLNPKALDSDKMVKVFNTLRMIESFTDKNSPGRDWNLATAMVYKGQAAMQFMGDWAKGEFKVAGKKPNIDYVAVDIPQTSGSYLYNIDSFVMFKQKNPDQAKGQAELAKLILSTKFQIIFNTLKGSIPVAQGVPRTQFDDIALRSMDELNSAAFTHTLLPSMSQQMAVPDAVRGAFFDVVTKFWNSKMSAKEATKLLAKEIKNAVMMSE